MFTHANKVQSKQPLLKFFIFINMYALYNNAKRNIKFHSSLNRLLDRGAFIKCFIKNRFDIEEEFYGVPNLVKQFRNTLNLLIKSTALL